MRGYLSGVADGIMHLSPLRLFLLPQAGETDRLRRAGEAPCAEDGDHLSRRYPREHRSGANITELINARQLSKTDFLYRLRYILHFRRRKQKNRNQMHHHYRKYYKITSP